MGSAAAMGQNCCATNDEKCLEAAVGAVDRMVEEHHDQDTAAFECASMDPTVGFPEAVKEECASMLEQTIELFVRKEGPADKLGMDVKHLMGRLVVVKIFPGGAVERANMISQRRKPPGDTIEAGDIITQVNGVRDVDADMVGECQSSNELFFRAVRR